MNLFKPGYRSELPLECREVMERLKDKLPPGAGGDILPAANPFMENKKETLAAWLCERKVDMALRGNSHATANSADRESDATCAGLPAVRGIDTDPEPRPGQVRLISFSAKTLQDMRPPLPALVLSSWEDDAVLMAPFSPYRTPASGGELRLRQQTGAWPDTLVLACWCATTVSRANAAACWWLGDIPDDELAAAWSVFRHVAVGVPLPPELEERVGPPIMQADDPRLEYQRELASAMRCRFPFDGPAPQ